MINLSIDASDLEGQFDPNINEIESFVELVYEVFLDQGDVLPETDEPDPESETCFPFLDHIIPAALIQLSLPFNYLLRKDLIHISISYCNPLLDILAPPPKG